MATAPVSVQLNGIGRDFGGFTALHDINLDVEAGNFVSLLGPSGCGKTTTLRLIAGFDSPSRGKIHIGGKDVTRLPPNRRKLGMVFQNYALFPHMTVAENIGFGLRMAGVAKAEIAAKVMRMLDMIHLKQHGDRMPSQLSGGQQQRVAIARSLVTEPSVLLLDEPMGALDKNLRNTMQAELRQMQQNFGITTILVTHDQDEALTMSDTVVVMESGFIRQVGSPEQIYNRPTSRFVANFLGVSNNLPAMATDGAAAGHSSIELRFQGFAPVQTTAPSQGLAGPVVLSVRPEKISLSADRPNRDEQSVNVAGTVARHVFRGAYHDYSISVDPESPVISVYEQARLGERQPSWSVGDRVWISWPATAHTIFADKT